MPVTVENQKGPAIPQAFLGKSIFSPHTLAAFYDYAILGPLGRKGRLRNSSQVTE